MTMTEQDLPQRITDTLALMKILDRTVEEGDCLIWTGATGRYGHPLYRASNGPCTYVRREVFRLAGGVLAARVPIATTCDERKCVNADHLVSSTIGKISRKAAKNGAWTVMPRVMKMAATMQKKVGKLTMSQAREIRQSSESSPVLAARYGVDKTVVTKIKRGKSWRDYSSPWTGLGGRSA